MDLYFTLTVALEIPLGDINLLVLRVRYFFNFTVLISSVVLSLKRLLWYMLIAYRYARGHQSLVDSLQHGVVYLVRLIVV